MNFKNNCLFLKLNNKIMSEPLLWICDWYFFVVLVSELTRNFLFESKLVTPIEGQCCFVVAIVILPTIVLSHRKQNQF